MNRDDRIGVERYAYCLCLHVRPGTIFVGVINLGGSLICGILFLALMSYTPEGTNEGSSSWGGSGSGSGGRHRYGSDHSVDRSTATTLAIIIYMMCATVSAMLLYGVIKSRPSYLMPFFGIQLCDFFFTLPAFMASLYTTPATYNHWENGASGSWMDVKRIWHNATPTTVYTSNLLITTCVVLFKGYFLCVVWKCYRYLKMKEMILPLHLPYQQSGMVPDIMCPPMMIPPPVAAMAAPPDYDEATKGASPPDYESAMRGDEFKFKFEPSQIPPQQPPTAQQQIEQQQQQQQQQQLEHEHNHEVGKQEKSNIATV